MNMTFVCVCVIISSSINVGESYYCFLVDIQKLITNYFITVIKMNSYVITSMHQI